MAALTIANLNGVLKYMYPPKKMMRVFNRRRILSAKLERRSMVTDEGLDFRFNVHTGATSAGGFVVEGATIFNPEAQSHDWLIFNMMSYLHPVQLTGQAKHANKRGKGGVVKLWEHAVNSAVQDARDDYAIAHYTPMNGRLTECGAFISDDPAKFEVMNARRLRVGQYVAVALTSDDSDVDNGYGTGTWSSDRTIASIDRTVSPARITLSGGLSGTQGSEWAADPNTGKSLHSVYDSKAHLVSSRVFGLEDIISANNAAVNNGSTVNYGKVDRTSAGNEWNKGNVKDLNGGIITDDVADMAMDLVTVTGNGEVDFFVTTPEIMREIKKNAIQTKRATMREKIADMWFEYVELAGKKVYADKYCTKGAIYGLDMDNIFIAECKASGWEDEDGQVVHALETVWGYQALLTRMFQIVALPNCHVAITNVNETNYGVSA